MANKPGFLVTLRSYTLSLGEFIVVGVVFVVALFGALFFMMAPSMEGAAPPTEGRGDLLGRAVEARACLEFNQNVRGLAAEATLEDALATIRTSDPHCDGLADFPAALGAIASHDAKFREDLNGRGWPLTVGGVASALDSFIFTNIEKRDAARRAVIEAETAALRETLRTQQVHQRDVDEASQGE